jgi:hypothetical protein
MTFPGMEIPEDAPDISSYGRRLTLRRQKLLEGGRNPGSGNELLEPRSAPTRAPSW